MFSVIFARRAWAAFTPVFRAGTTTAVDDRANDLKHYDIGVVPRSSEEQEHQLLQQEQEQLAIEIAMEAEREAGEDDAFEDVAVLCLPKDEEKEDIIGAVLDWVAPQ
jgi:hypothetical protein